MLSSNREPNVKKQTTLLIRTQFQFSEGSVILGAQLLVLWGWDVPSHFLRDPSMFNRSCLTRQHWRWSAEWEKSCYHHVLGAFTAKCDSSWTFCGNSWTFSGLPVFSFTPRGVPAQLPPQANATSSDYGAAGKKEGSSYRSLGSKLKGMESGKRFAPPSLTFTSLIANDIFFAQFFLKFWWNIIGTLPVMKPNC